MSVVVRMPLPRVDTFEPQAKQNILNGEPVADIIDNANLAWVLPRWSEAFELYKSIEHLTTGHPRGHVAYRLGLLYKKGYGGNKPEDHETGENLIKDALPLVQKSAEAGDCEALCDLGHMYENGNAVTADQSLAVKYYKEAAEKGYPRGLYNLAVMTQSDMNNSKCSNNEKNNKKKIAMEFYTQAASAEYPCAQYNLACMFFRDENYKDAVRFYAKAAEWGDCDAQKQVTKMFTEEKFQAISVKFLAEEWTSYYSKLSTKCQQVLLEIHWIFKNIPLSENIPQELIGEIAREVVLAWPKEDIHYQDKFSTELVFKKQKRKIR